MSIQVQRKIAAAGMAGAVLTILAGLFVLSSIMLGLGARA